jgi:hypothetical protein
MIEVSKGVTVDYKDGKVVVEAQVAQFANPVLDDLKAKVESGAIDPIKGTDIDKSVLLSAIDFLKAAVNK